MKETRKKRLLTNVTKKNKLGSGREGTVYNAINAKGTHYALKEGKLGKEEVEFATTVAAKYPTHFMTLYDSAEGSALWSKVDCTLQTIHPSNKILYDLYIQIFYILTILQKERWTHNDFHPGNIGLVMTKRKYIKINGTMLPTHDYLVQAIDYGSVRKGFRPIRDVYKLFSVVKENDIDTDVYRIKKVKLDHDIRKKIEKYLPVSYDSEWIHKDCMLLLLHLLFPKEFKKLYPALSISNYLPKFAMLYIIQHMEYPDVCLEYLLKNRQNV
jgi:hypothetical protein